MKGLVEGYKEQNKIELDIPNVYVSYENLEMLIGLYNLIPDLKLKEWFIKLIVNHLKNDDCSGLCFYFLFRVKKFELLRVSIKKRIKKDLSFNDILIATKNILKYEHNNLNEIELKKFENIISGVINHIFNKYPRLSYDAKYNNKFNTGIYELISQIKVMRLKKELKENFNYEINQDKEKVQEFVRIYGFDKRISEAFNKIDELYLGISEDEFDFRNNISLLKEIFKRAMDSVLKEIETITNEKPIKLSDKEDPTLTRHRFITQNLSFSEGENKTMSSLNYMLNEEHHSLISKKEKFRLVRNFTIEFILLVFSKLQSLKEG